ncbi:MULTISPECIES: thioredoxin family protein [Thauera]|jgi:thioredoxin reductase (NADPH)|uniref:Thiol reductase thioredoxin n=1 Tax=Thauera humireducens TaxID=1134435 RepID=A0A140IDR5_9RHOO|nr:MULTISPECIES: thioredoxin family protein [Thauera]AMO35890.1 thiol reductase thioredoxin [Thauera humireducens]ENO79852.1 thioredoxin-disulfide reductase [Thauera sp. 63]
MSALHPIQSLPAHPRLADGPVIVIALCADWCGTCREFQPVLERIALAHPEMVFAWADIEDDAELVGDIELDSFPTLAIFHHGTPLHFGASLPLEPVVTRLIRSAAATPAGAPRDIPAEVLELGARLAG